MIRLIVENAVLFLLPSALYFGYVTLMGNKGTPGAAVLNDAPVVWLMLAGVALVMMTLIAFSANTNGGRPGDGYVPPILKNGRIEPGHVETGPTK